MTGKNMRHRQPEAHTAASLTGTGDTAYFAHRAEAEVIAAQRATHPAAVAAHYAMSRAYLDLAYPDHAGCPTSN